MIVHSKSRMQTPEMFSEFIRFCMRNWGANHESPDSDVRFKRNADVFNVYECLWCGEDRLPNDRSDIRKHLMDHGAIEFGLDREQMSRILGGRDF